MNKAMSNLQHEEAGTKDNSNDDRSNQDRSKSDNKKSGPKVGWCTFQSATLQATTLKQTNKTESKFKNEIILDTGSTLPATFMNPDMVTNIKDSRYPLVMNTNAGSKMLTKQADVRGFGKAWFDKDQMANIFRFAGTVDRYKVTYDSTKEDAFNVHTKNGIVKFKRNKEGLYTYKPNTSFYNEVAEAKRNETSHMVTTVTENKVGFTKRQVEDAKRARKLYHTMGCPMVQNFKHLLRQNIIQNCPVTAEDVDNAEKIFGPDIRAMKGKTTRKKPTPVKKDEVAIPKELLDKNSKLTLCMDVMFINGMPMLTSID